MNTEIARLPRLLGGGGKGGAVKRLTLDLADDLHRTLKVTAAQLEVPMAELLRALVAEALKKPTALRKTAAQIRERPDAE